MPPKFARFLNSEEGAASTDWIVGSAFAIGLCIMAYSLVGGGAHDHAERVEATFQDRGIPMYGLSETSSE